PAVLLVIDGTVVVAVHPLELGAQTGDCRTLPQRVPAPAELLLRQHAVAVGIPALEYRVAGVRVGTHRLLLADRHKRQRQHQPGQRQPHPAHTPASAAAGAAAGIADSKVMRSRISGVRRPISIGLRTFGRKHTSNTSLMSPSKRIQLSTSPLANETICTPHHGSASRLRSSSSRPRPSKRWLRGLDRPTAATLPAIDRPRAKPGTKASGTNFFFSRSTQPRCPVPALSTHSRPLAQRGECGMDSPSQTISSVSTAITTPPSRRRSRQPSTVSLRQTAVTYFGRPCTIARPLRWQRSSGASLLMNFGFQIALKLWVGLSSARQEYLVLTNTTLPFERMPSSWMSRSPMVCALRGT